VGLEAAIRERKRNSTLVEFFSAENERRLKKSTEATEKYIYISGSGTFRIYYKRVFRKKIFSSSKVRMLT